MWDDALSTKAKLKALADFLISTPWVVSLDNFEDNLVVREASARLCFHDEVGESEEASLSLRHALKYLSQALFVSGRTMRSVLIVTCRYQPDAPDLWQESGRLLPVLPLDNASIYKKVLRLPALREILNGLNSLGNLCEVRKEWSQAKVYFSEALEIGRAIGDSVGVSNYLGNLGLIAIQQRELSVALAHYQEALTLKRELGDHPGCAGTIRGIGDVYLAQKRLDAAQRYYEIALGIYQHLEDKAGIGLCLAALDGVYDARQDWPTAFVYASLAYRVFVALDWYMQEQVLRSLRGLRQHMSPSVYEELCDTLPERWRALPIFDTLSDWLHTHEASAGLSASSFLAEL